jgi:hypothetical protein
MTIRTTLGHLYESRSQDDGENWSSAQPTQLVSPSAPSTVVRDPTSDDLWMFWCCNAAGAAAGWGDRSPQAVCISKDNGQTWGAPRLFEDDLNRGFGYISVDVVRGEVLLTYYDWARGNPNFYLCQLRQRKIDVAWFRDFSS